MPPIIADGGDELANGRDASMQQLAAGVPTAAAETSATADAPRSREDRLDEPVLDRDPRVLGNLRGPGLQGPMNSVEQDQIRALQSKYRSGTSCLGSDFFQPCLDAATSYSRAAGFFTSTALVTWSAVLPRLAARSEPKIRLLAAPLLLAGDREALVSAFGESPRRSVLQGAVDSIVADALAFARDPTDVGRRVRLFAWFVATGRLDLRFIVPKSGDPDAIYHEKFGVFDFPWGDRIAFTGSANETLPAHTSNFESLDVFRSWVPHELERVAARVEDFELSWTNRAPGADTLELSADVLSRVREIGRRVTPDADGTGGVSEAPPPYSAAGERRWRHQGEALAAFLEKRRGVLEMATGTGKTRTAIDIARRLVLAGEVTTIIIAADGNDLMEQWYRQLLPFAMEPGVQFAVLRSFGGHHDRDRFGMSPRRKILIASRLSLPAALRSASRVNAEQTLLIHDEVHRLGSPGNRKNLEGLSDAIRFRLGLSATPEREYDADGTKFIEQHVGPVIFKFSLEDAIRRGVLCAFDYKAISYVPTQDDRERVQSVIASAAARRAAGENVSEEEVWIQVARVYKTSRAKLPLFRAYLHENPGLLKRCLVFVETTEYGTEVVELIHRWRTDFHTYYADEDPEALRRFANKEIECLVTCHRLSEGIDIHSVANVVLFSASRARLETIQRLGRCLRIDPASPNKRACVVDFVRSDKPVDQDDATADESRRDWLRLLSKTVCEE